MFFTLLKNQGAFWIIGQNTFIPRNAVAASKTN
jgi:hypothetical protein